MDDRDCAERGDLGKDLPPETEFYGESPSGYTKEQVIAAIAPYKAELANVRMHDQATGIQWRAQYARAEKAEAENSLLHERHRDDLAENAKLRELLREAQGYIDDLPSDGADLCRRIDAALGEKKDG